MHVELKKELKQLERELSVIVARFLKIYDEVVTEDDESAGEAATPPEEPRQEPPVALDNGFPTDYLNAYA